MRRMAVALTQPLLLYDLSMLEDHDTMQVLIRLFHRPQVIAKRFIQGFRGLVRSL